MNKLNKFLAAALCIAVCGTLFGEDGERPPLFTPTFDVNLSLVKELTVKTDTKEQLHYAGSTGEILPLDVNGGVKIRLLDNLFLTPYLQYKKDKLLTSPNSLFGLGIRLSSEVITGLKLGFDTAYLVNFEQTATALWTGFKIKPEITYTTARSLFSISVFDNFEFFDNARTKVNKKVMDRMMKNELNTGIIFNVFNYLKEDINSGIYADFILTTDIENKKQSETWKTKMSNKIEYEFGLITNPLDWFQAKTGFIGTYNKTKDEIRTPVTEETAVTSGWLIGFETKYRNFSFGADYTLFDYTVNEKTDKNVVHHAVNISVKYSY